MGWIIWATTLNSLNLSFFLRTILDPFVYVAIPLLVLSGWKVPLSVTANRRLADLSYPLYLFHAPILILVLSLLYTVLPKFPQAPAVLLASASCLLLSGTIGVTLERFFLELRRNSQKNG